MPSRVQEPPAPTFWKLEYTSRREVVQIDSTTLVVPACIDLLGRDGPVALVRGSVESMIV
ncbi:MAG: hypothetical protein M3373_08745 [Gemmatimonadota bacterium]|nr:hypothetical protein [Gemmatimonadota bacterium]